jgi:hypothetical protein
LEVEIVPFDFTPNIKSLLFQQVNWTVRLHGQTEAFITHARLLACIGDPLTHPKYKAGFDNMGLRRVISPADRIVYGACPVSTSSASGDDVSGLDKEMLKKGEVFLHCAGLIEFTDVFGDKWILPFKRRWIYGLFVGGNLDSEYWGGEWYPEGDNEEYKAN